MIRITLVRHGRTAWNVDPGQLPAPGTPTGRRFRGIVDLPLAPQGIEQARTTARRLADWMPAAIYSSPLQRALRTARLLAKPHGQDVQVLPGLSSMDYGAWAGRLASEVAREWPAVVQQWRRDPFGVQIPGGESTAALRDRAVDAVRQILDRHAAEASAPGQRTDVVVVTHQVVTRTLICTLAGLPDEAYWRVHQDLCNLSQLDYEPESGKESGSFSLRSLNDTCHLDPSLPGKHSNGVRIILVRHGQTAWNLGSGPERFRGRTDLPLDGTGQAQALALARRLRSEPIDAVYSSPLQRAQQTVAPLAAHLRLPVVLDERLQDINYGAFQGLDRQEATAAFPRQYQAWLTTPGQVRLPRGESLDDVRRRLVDLLDELANQYRGRTVLLAGHQVVNKVLACTLLGLDLDRIWHVGQDTAAINVFQQVNGTWHILRLNDTCYGPTG
jgi:probable phosphoglycerate mutase